MLQVIWAIGISMVLMGLLIRLPFNAILVIGLIIVLGHNILDFPEAALGFKAGFWWDLLHHGKFAMYPFAPNHYIVILYPFLPWTGLMMLGYCAGTFYTQQYNEAQRRKYLLGIGSGLIVFFIVLRLVNMYGDPLPWSLQKNIFYTLLSFIKVQKYPPSLLYMCITIGASILLLAVLEKYKNRFTAVMQIYGRTAFFYYILHFYLVHLICMICFFARGHSMQDAINSARNLPFLFIVPGEGYSLGAVYLIWLAVVASLYPICKWYDGYKTKHKEKRWLSYL
jgi:uncharacterized membrane protein